MCQRNILISGKKNFGSRCKVKTESRNCLTIILMINVDCDIAQVVGRRIPTAAARVTSCGICGGQSGIGAGFLRVLWFSLLIIPLTTPQSSSSGASTIGQTVTDVPGGLSLTPKTYVYAAYDDNNYCGGGGATPETFQAPYTSRF
jgi:hypothetical protein